MMSKEIEYKDLIAFHPGSYVEEIVEELNITQAEFAKRLEISPKTVSKIISGEDDISPSTANKLARLTGISMQTWLNLQAKYDAKVQEIKNAKNDDEKRACEFINLRYLKDNHFIEDKRYPIDEKRQKLRELLKLANLSQLFEFNAAVSYRRSRTENDEKSILLSNVMLELAVNNARNVTTNKYRKTKLVQLLPTIRKMNVQDPQDFYPKLKKLLLDCGIVLIALPQMPGARLNGATKKFKNGSVLLMITDRNKSADIFWFSLIHEIGHIYYEDFYSDYDDQAQYEKKEQAADKFASEFFIPYQDYEAFKNEGVYTESSIKQFATKLNILPGMVVGRLQLDKLVGYDSFNYLKSKYEIVFNSKNFS
ncbi:HigA family addiction module antitoxin [Lactiplantibacillus pentosus]|uniref:HigA family addiction module antitoxin n=1 Tax=Lactiplantibacillus pentosus TaxID=1589 RepID=UPI002182389D|nr:HigA family addiction module antitoxin [Lactiplantibacillus pentosus]MCT0163164.1 addiction module antidote protein, HigA family [Lactiplantibacillus pentosus]